MAACHRVLSLAQLLKLFMVTTIARKATQTFADVMSSKHSLSHQEVQVNLRLILPKTMVAVMEAQMVVFFSPTQRLTKLPNTGIRLTHNENCCRMLYRGCNPTGVQAASWATILMDEVIDRPPNHVCACSVQF